MDNRIKAGHLSFAGPGAQVRKQAQPGPSAGTHTFKQALDRSVLKFSHHAEVRMAQRGITFKPETLTKIIGAIEQAAAKGAKDSLVLYRDIAMIVHVPSRTVVTAIDGSSVQGTIFTQIDSAVIVS